MSAQISNRDFLGWRRTFGVPTPSPNTCVQPEFDEMRPRGVTNHIARMMANDTQIKSDSDFERAIDGVIQSLDLAVDQVATCRPDHLILGISSVSIWGGTQAWGDQLKERMSARAGGIPVTLPSEALIAALRAYGVKKYVSVVEPYFPMIQPRIESFLGEHGYEVVMFNHLKGTQPTKYPQVTAQYLVDALRSVDGPNVEAIIQFGANLPMARINGEAERWLGKPVIGVNTSTYWHALRTSGIDDRIPGFTRLLSDF